MPKIKIDKTEVQTIIKEVDTGNRPLYVFGIDDNSYFLKGKKLLRPINFAIVREFLCSAFLLEWEIKTPSVKGVTIDPELVLSSKPSRNPSWLDYRGHTCFGSRKIDGLAFEVTQIFDLSQVRKLKSYADPYELFRIGLFDLWVCNEDRNIRHSNLMLFNAGRGLEFSAIDHELTFASSSFDQLELNMDLSWNDSILDCEFVKKVLKTYPVQLPDFHAYFEQSVKKCRSKHNDILNSIETCRGITIPGKPELEQFLYASKRLKRVFDNFKEYF